MTREIIWRSEDGVGAEYLFLTESDGRIIADSVVFATRDAEPSRTAYRAEMDAQWRVRRIDVQVTQPDEESRSLVLTADGEGQWWDAAGNALPHLDGCLDIDISATPFTNTLPIRRLHLQPGQAEEITVVYINVPSLQVEVWPQRYTGLEQGQVRYASTGTDFQRDLVVDADGLVVSYPGLFQRVLAR